MNFWVWRNNMKDEINKVCDSMKDLLIHKNSNYGNSALKPLNPFSKLDADNSICIRLDDKLARVKNSNELRKNDVSDLIGYLVLLCISKGWTDFSEFKD